MLINPLNFRDVRINEKTQQVNSLVLSTNMLYVLLLNANDGLILRSPMFSIINVGYAYFDIDQTTGQIYLVYKEIITPSTVESLNFIKLTNFGSATFDYTKMNYIDAANKLYPVGIKFVP